MIDNQEAAEKEKVYSCTFYLLKLIHAHCMSMHVPMAPIYNL